MLFAAVTLGFFAENIREHSIIDHRIEQNKIAILKDLEADAVTIDSLLVTEQTSIKSIPDIVATTFTLYVNNSSFKNMQSSGLLSYVEEEDLKNSII